MGFLSYIHTQYCTVQPEPDDVSVELYGYIFQKFEMYEDGSGTYCPGSNSERPLSFNYRKPAFTDRE